MNNQLSTTTTQTMSSLEIAELTGKNHKEVLRDIRKILEEVEIDSAQFCAQYKDESGKSNPYFNLPERECHLIISGYSAKHRLVIIDRWTDLENKQQLQNKIIDSNNFDAIDAKIDKIVNLIESKRTPNKYNKKAKKVKLKSITDDEINAVMHFFINNDGQHSIDRIVEGNIRKNVFTDKNYKPDRIEDILKILLKDNLLYCNNSSNYTLYECNSNMRTVWRYGYNHYFKTLNGL